MLKIVVVVVLCVEPEVPGHVEGRDDDHDKEDSVADVKDGQVHAVRGDGTLVHVIVNLDETKSVFNCSTGLGIQISVNPGSVLRFIIEVNQP